MIIQAVVPVAGLGTRMLPATKAQPKEMLPVAGKPVVQHVVEELVAAGVRRVGFVTGRDKRAIEDHFDADPELRRALAERGRTRELAALDALEGLGVEYAYVRQPEQRGLGDAVLCAEALTAGEPFVLALGDSLLTGTGVLAALIEAVTSGRAEAAVAVERVGLARASRYGIVDAGADGLARDLVEKPEDPTSDLAVAGRYVLGPSVFAALRTTLPGAGGEIQLTDALRTLVRDGMRLAVVELPAGVRRHDVGSHEGYERAFLAHARPPAPARPVASGRAFARAALAGNPSDGYGGRTLAVAVRDFAAHVRVVPAERVRIAGEEEAGSLGELAAEAGTHGCEGAERLVRAALVRFVAEAEARGRPEVARASVELHWRTSIPRQVGLAGSSAIVTAALRALGDHFGLALEPDDLAQTALASETEELGIAAGLQDRVVQSYEGLVAMDFASGRFDSLDPALLPPLYLAWRADATEASGVVHSDLRRRHAAGDPEVRTGLEELAALAGRAHTALLEGDRATLHDCVDGSFDVRRRIIALDPRHVRMVELARAHGASANYAGSGGAVIGTLPASDPERAFAALGRALAAEGCVAIRPTVR